MTKRILPDISFYQIQLFLTIAEHQNFSRAADMMNITQPALSKRIAALEHAVGVKLIDRDKRPIALTEEGEFLRQKWVKICEEIQTSISAVSELGKDRNSGLTIGWFDSGNSLGPLSLVAKQLSQESTAPFKIVATSFVEWRSHLADGKLDLVITLTAEADSLSDDLAWEEIVSCPEMVCMLESHPLCSKDQISVEDLRDQKFLMMSPLTAPFYYRIVSNLCLEHGFEPKLSRYANHPNSAIIDLRDEDVLICDRFLRHIDSPMIKCYELANATSGLIAVWRKHDSNPLIRSFVVNLKRQYQENQQAHGQ